MITTPNPDEISIEADGSDDSESLVLPASQREILTKADDRQVTSLHAKKQKGRLILQPDFQRQFVWDRRKASRLIESALLKVPLPIIYLSEQAEGVEHVIDGQQRLTSFFAFIDGVFPDGKPFTLQGLSAFRELEGKSFQQLSEQQQEKITEYNLRTVTLLRQSDDDLKFEIFERLNTGSEPLNDMELRNCIYRGPYMALLRDLAADADFRTLLGFSGSDRRMRDIELVLRFAAFYHATYLKYQSPMKRFFNHDMKAHQQISDKGAATLRNAFKNALSIVRSLFGKEHAFKRYYGGNEKDTRGRWESKKFNASLYDALMGVFAEQDKNRVMACLDSLREGIVDLMANDRGFNEAIELSTSSVGAVRRRFDNLRAVVETILAEHRVQSRCFTRALKEELFHANPTCELCGNTIQELDDAAVDHIEQYWRGGKTIPENARLAHRYCNAARPRKD